MFNLQRASSNQAAAAESGCIPSPHSTVSSAQISHSPSLALFEAAKFKTEAGNPEEIIKRWHFRVTHPQVKLQSD